MEVQIVKIEKGRLRMKISGETFTFGNILQKALMDDDRILGAGFHQPHPFQKEIFFDVYFKEEVEESQYREIIIECVEKMLNYLSELRDSILNLMEVGK